jgi:hypothetical protein
VQLRISSLSTLSLADVIAGATAVLACAASAEPVTMLGRTIDVPDRMLEEVAE